MFWRIFWEVAAACALVWIATYGVKAVLSLEQQEARPITHYTIKQDSPVLRNGYEVAPLPLTHPMEDNNK